jgi:hypothetical protein
VSLQLIKAARVLRFDAAAGWPEAFTTDQAIALQTWCEGIEAKAWRAKADDLRRLLALALNADTVQVTTTARTESVPRSENREIMPGQRRLMHWTEHVQVKTRHITAAAFAAWLAANELEPSHHVAAWFKALGVQAQSSAIEPSAELEEKEPTEQPRLLKKKALLEELASDWPTIEKDIREASRNGLDSAKGGKHGMWNAKLCRDWAESKGKLKKAAQVISLQSSWPPANTTRNRMK